MFVRRNFFCCLDAGRGLNPGSSRGAIFLAVLLACVPSALFAVQSAPLIWKPSPNTNVTGYNIYYGTESGVYSDQITVGNVTNTVVGGLLEGVTYYFAATSFDAANHESIPSNEASYAVPNPAGVTNTVPDPTPDPTNANDYYTDPYIFTAPPYIPQPVVLGFETYHYGDGTSSTFVVASGDVPNNWSLESSTNLQSWTELTSGDYPWVFVQIPTDAPRMFFRLKTVIPPPSLAVLNLATVSSGGRTTALELTASGNVPFDWILESSTDLKNWIEYDNGSQGWVDVQIPLTAAPKKFFRLKSQ